MARRPPPLRPTTACPSTTSSTGGGCRTSFLQPGHRHRAPRCRHRTRSSVPALPIRMTCFFCVLCFIIIFLIVYIRAWEPNRRHLHGHKLDGGTGPNWECAADSASTAALIYLHCSASAPPPPTSLPVSLYPSPPFPSPFLSSSLLSSPLPSTPPHSHTGFLEHEGRWRGWWSCIQRGAGPPDCLHV